MVEAFKWAYAERSTLGDPSDEEYADQINEVHQNFNWQYPSYIGNRSLTIFFVKNMFLMLIFNKVRLSKG